VAAERNLIVNADDFGLSAAVNAGIVEAHERGIVTSTSMMVRRPAAGEAAALATPRPSLAIGLHLDLGQWDYDEGEWRIAYENCPPDDPAAVDAECRAQVDAFRALLGREPTHLDSHQHAHEHEPGWTEFGCHPGIGVGAESSYAAEREIEVGALCDPLVKEAIDREEVRLRSFAELD
jgi:predicted glycoside hydrolase/deacetylase ChbG (UPF0249 family)